MLAALFVLGVVVSSLTLLACLSFIGIGANALIIYVFGEGKRVALGAIILRVFLLEAVVCLNLNWFNELLPDSILGTTLERVATAIISNLGFLEVKVERQLLSLGVHYFVRFNILALVSEVL